LNGTECKQYKKQTTPNKRAAIQCRVTHVKKPLINVDPCKKLPLEQNGAASGIEHLHPILSINANYATTSQTMSTDVAKY
jgi:hypothetical protein